MYETREERTALFDFTGKYTEIELLNKRATGFGWAVLVEDNFEGRRRKVIKLPNSESATRELLVEADILTKISQYLHHRNLISLHSVDKYVIEWNGKKEDRWFLVLQFGGQNLRTRLGRLGVRDNEFVYLNGAPLALEEIFNVATQVTDGLRALHEFEESPGQHIIHRDIKPENILIDEDGTIRLADFGISKIVERITQSVTAMGTPPYLAPECSRGRLHACSDIYSLGIVLYEMATGQFPFRTMQDRFYEMPRPPHELNPETPESLSEVILRCLHWNPCAEREKEEAERYQAASELLDDLRRCYRRLYPVPPRFQKIGGQGSLTTLYQDAETEEKVRVFLYGAERPELCRSHLARVEQEIGGVCCPRHTFESEGCIGVVTPLSPDGKPVASAVQINDGETCHQFVHRVADLARQVQQLHCLGIYHGLLAPCNVYLDGGAWWIDQVWIGQLVGLVDVASVLKEGSDFAGYLAPEILAWRSLPTLSSDVYGIGSVLFGCLVGAPPLAPSVAHEISHGAVARSYPAASGIRQQAPFVSRRLEAVIVKALQSDPMRRHRTMEELIDELAACRWPEDMALSLVEDAKEAQKQNRLVEAYEALDSALRLDPGNAMVHHTRAELFFLEGEATWALKENQKALDIEPTASVLFLHGQCLAALGRCGEAEQYYRRGLERDNCSRGRHLLAKCLEGVGRDEMALEEYEHAVRIAETVEGNKVKMQEIRADLSALVTKMEG